MRVFALLPALVLLVVGSVASAQPGWTRYSYPEAKFSVTFAKPPVTAPAATGPYPTTTWSVEGVNQTVVLATNFGVELPDVKVAFDAAANGRNQNGGTVISRRDFTYMGAPAMDLTFRTATGLRIVDRVIYRKGWLYQLMIPPNADDSIPAWGQQFFDSFRFID